MGADQKAARRTLPNRRVGSSLVEQSPKKIHVVTRTYLTGWTLNGLLRPVSVRYGPQKLKTPAAVAWEHEWWGAGAPALNEACEEACAKLENLLPDTLAAVEADWPLDTPTTAVVAELMALHVLRTRAFQQWFTPVRDASLAEYRDRFPDEQSFERWKRDMQTDRRRAERLLSAMNKLSTVLGSMHWSLLRFDEPLLITGDQPVCPVSLPTTAPVQPISAMPGAGWLDTYEVRFPLTPRLALLATWYMGTETEPIAGTREHAANLNASVARQASEQWFQTPACEPAWPAETEGPSLLLPLAADILPGYSTGSAVASPLRSRTRKHAEDLIELQDHKTVMLTRPEALSPSGAG